MPLGNTGGRHSCGRMQILACTWRTVPSPSAVCPNRLMPRRGHSCHRMHFDQDAKADQKARASKACIIYHEVVSLHDQLLGTDSG